jgi:hypothetical protein
MPARCRETRRAAGGAGPVGIAGLTAIVLAVLALAPVTDVARAHAAGNDPDARTPACATDGGEGLASGAVTSASGASGDGLARRCRIPSFFSVDLLRAGLVRLPGRGGEASAPEAAGVFAQRAIDDGRRRPSEDEPDEDGTEDDDEPGEPVPPSELGLESVGQPEAKSPVKAMLLSAALPGLGELYAGSNRGYVFMGVEAVSWITYASFRSSSNSKEEEMFGYADEHFSIERFEDLCVGQDGQSCADAASALNDFFRNDKPEYYEIISKNTIYRAGWGAVQYDNQPPPEDPESEAYRIWVANFAAAQDNDFITYNKLRDDRNDLSRTARSMTVVALLNHLASAWHSFFLARGLQTGVGENMEMELEFEPSFAHPGARLVLSRTF